MQSQGQSAPVKLIPLGMLRLQIQQIPKDKKTVTLFKAGLRAYEAQTNLAGSGFREVRVMEGGRKGWPYERFMEKRNFACGPAALHAKES
jgi:rhodanese-related sulfurtransferase